MSCFPCCGIGPTGNEPAAPSLQPPHPPNSMGAGPSATATNQSTANRPYTVRWWCCQLGLRDVAMGAIEAVIGAETVVTMVALKSLAVGGFGLGALGIAAIIHWRWRIDGEVADLHHVVTGELQPTVAAATANVGHAEDVVAGLAGVVGTLSTDTAALQKATDALPQERDTLQGNVERLEGINKTLEEQNQGLKKNVETLQGQLDQLKGALKTFKAQLEARAQQNEELKSTVGSVDQEVSGLSAIRKEMKVDVEHFDTTFDEDVRDLDKLIMRVHATSEEIFQLLGKEIASLKDTVTHFDQVCRQMQSGAADMQSMITKLEQEKAALLEQLTQLKNDKERNPSPDESQVVGQLEQMLLAQQAAIQQLKGGHGDSPEPQ